MGDNIIDGDLLDDINDLDDDEIQVQGNQEEEDEDSNEENIQNEDGQPITNQDKMKEINDAQEEFEQELRHAAKEVSYLLKDTEFTQFIENIRVFVISKPKGVISVDHEEYGMIKKANEYGAIVDREIQAVHKYVKDNFHKKFSELEKIVLNPVDYVKCVKLIQNKNDYVSLDFSKLLTSHQILAITVSESTFIGEQLTELELKSILAACEVVLKLDEFQKLLLLYVETRMHFIAPNLSELVGTQCASKLMGAAGGIQALSVMPACNIQVMGSQKKALLGLSKAGMGFNRGYFGQLDFVQSAPPLFQTRLVRMLSTNVAKSCRIDALRTCPDGSAGKKIKEQMLQRFEKIQEAPEGKLDKPIAPPDDKPKKKRGGKKQRKIKERLAQTEIRKYQNRLTFGPEAEGEFRQSGVGFGQLTNSVGQSTGKIKVNVNKNQKLKLSKKTQERLVQMNSVGGDSGISSSIAFTPVQGMELVNPQKFQQARPDNYFNKEAGFRTVAAENQKKKTLADMLGAQGVKK